MQEAHRQGFNDGREQLAGEIKTLGSNHGVDTSGMTVQQAFNAIQEKRDATKLAELQQSQQLEQTANALEGAVAVQPNQGGPGGFADGPVDPEALMRQVWREKSAAGAS